MADLYANPALRQSELNREGNMIPSRPDTAEVMDSVFFNIENNTAKILKSNYEGSKLDDQAKDNLLSPEDVWAQYGVKTEEPISEGNALRIRDNMDEVAARNYNVNTLDHTSLNQARTFINGIGGAILTDPVNWALGATTMGLGLAAKSLVSSSKIFTAIEGLANTSKVTRIGTAAGIGATEGLIEGFLESEILLDQAPKAGIKFNEEDYWNNVRANVLFSGLFRSVGQAGKEFFGNKMGPQPTRDPEVVDAENIRLREEIEYKDRPQTFEAEFRRINESKEVARSFSEVDANVNSPNRRGSSFKTASSEVMTDLSPAGKYYTSHFSNGKVDFTTQTPVSRSNFGEGYQFSGSKQWAFSDKKFGTTAKESIFEIDPSAHGLKLYDAEIPLTRDMNERVFELVQAEIGWLPNSILKQIKDGGIEAKHYADLLATFDNKAGTKTIGALNSVLGTEGFHGFSFLEDGMDEAGAQYRGMHLFKMPEGMDAKHMNPDIEGATPNSKSDIDIQNELDFYSDPRNRLGFDPEIQKSMDRQTPDLPPSIPGEAHTREYSEISNTYSEIEAESSYIKGDPDIDNIVDKAVAKIGESIPPEKAREIVKAMDFCMRS